MGSPVSSSTLIIAIGYTAGMILDTKPIAPVLLSMFTEKKIKTIVNMHPIQAGPGRDC